MFEDTPNIGDLIVAKKGSAASRYLQRKIGIVLEISKMIDLYLYTVLFEKEKWVMYRREIEVIQKANGTNIGNCGHP